MRRSIHPALTAGVVAAVGLAAAAATLPRHGTRDHTAPAMETDLSVAAPAPSAPLAAAPVVDSAAPLPTSTSVSGDGMVVAVDPETGALGMPAPGQLGPGLSIDEAQAYARQIAKELITEHRSDGSSSLKHDDRLADYTVVRIGPDGKPVFQCVHGAQAMQSALCDNQPVAPAREEE